jgi:hypothetical protein
MISPKIANDIDYDHVKPGQHVQLTYVERAFKVPGFFKFNGLLIDARKDEEGIYHFKIKINEQNYPQYVREEIGCLVKVVNSIIEINTGSENFYNIAPLQDQSKWQYKINFTPIRESPEDDFNGDTLTDIKAEVYFNKDPDEYTLVNSFSVNFGPFMGQHSVANLEQYLQTICDTLNNATIKPFEDN